MEVVKKKKQKNKDTEKVRKKERKKYDRSIISHILKVQFDPEFPRSLPRASLSSLSSRISPYHLLLLFAVLLYTCILHVLQKARCDEFTLYFTLSHLQLLLLPLKIVLNLNGPHGHLVPQRTLIIA